MAQIAGLATALSVASAQAEDKWQPHADLVAKPGTERHIGELDLFIPLWQDPYALLFADLRAMGDDDENVEGNIGLGYREQTGDGWILGGYGFFDIRRTEHDNTFLQGTLGAEALSEDLDLRVNGYLPEQGKKDVDGMAGTEVVGTSIFVRDGKEVALWGMDGEAGVRLPVLEDTRVYAGGFYFGDDDADDLYGPKGRVETRVHDLAFLGPGSRLTVGAEGRWDDVRGAEGFGIARLRIPLGGLTGQGQAPLTGLDRRMVEPVVRDVDINTATGAFGKREHALNPKTGDIINSIYFTTAYASGAGTFEDPASLTDALDNGDLIVAWGDYGDFHNVQHTLSQGKILIGGGTEIIVEGEESGEMAPFIAAGVRPTFVGNGPGTGPILSLEGATTLAGVDLRDAGIGLQVGEELDPADNVMVMDVGIDDIDNGAGAAFAIDWRGAFGFMEDVRAGQVTGGFDTAGIQFFGADAWWKNVRVGKVDTDFDSPGIRFFGDDARWTDVEVGKVEGVGAPGIQFRGVRARWTGVKIDMVEGGTGATGILFSGDDARWTDVRIAKIEGDDSAAGIDYFGVGARWTGVKVGEVDSDGLTRGINIFGDGAWWTDVKVGKVEGGEDSRGIKFTGNDAWWRSVKVGKVSGESNTVGIDFTGDRAQWDTVQVGHSKLFHLANTLGPGGFGEPLQVSHGLDGLAGLLPEVGLGHGAKPGGVFGSGGTSGNPGAIGIDFSGSDAYLRNVGISRVKSEAQTTGTSIVASRASAAGFRVAGGGGNTVHGLWIDKVKAGDATATDGTDSNTASISAFGIDWNASGNGTLERVVIGTVMASTANASGGTEQNSASTSAFGIDWDSSGDGTLRQVGIGKIMAGASTAGGESEVNAASSAAFGIDWSASGNGTLEQVGIGKALAGPATASGGAFNDATSTAFGMQWDSSENGHLQHVGIGAVKADTATASGGDLSNAQTTATGIGWGSSGSGILEKVGIGTVIAGAASATDADMNDADSNAFGIAWFFSDNATLAHVGIGEVMADAATASGGISNDASSAAFGIDWFMSDNGAVSNLRIDSVTGPGQVFGLRLDTVDTFSLNYSLFAGIQDLAGTNGSVIRLLAATENLSGTNNTAIDFNVPLCVGTSTDDSFIVINEVNCGQ